MRVITNYTKFRLKLQFYQIGTLVGGSDIFIKLLGLLYAPLPSRRSAYARLTQERDSLCRALIQPLTTRERPEPLREHEATIGRLAPDGGWTTIEAIQLLPIGEAHHLNGLTRHRGAARLVLETVLLIQDGLVAVWPLVDGNDTSPLVRTLGAIGVRLSRDGRRGDNRGRWSGRFFACRQ